MQILAAQDQPPEHVELPLNNLIQTRKRHVLHYGGGGVFFFRKNAIRFGVLVDLCFGKSMEIKEPGENELEKVPHFIDISMKTAWRSASPWS